MEELPWTFMCLSWEDDLFAGWKCSGRVLLLLACAEQQRLLLDKSMIFWPLANRSDWTSWAWAEFHCITLVGETEALGVSEAAIKLWQNSLHGIRMVKTGLSACSFSHMQNTYHLLGDLFAISQICFRCSLYSLVSTWGEEGLSITLNFLQHVEPVQEPSALDAWPLASPTQT